MNYTAQKDSDKHLLSLAGIPFILFAIIAAVVMTIYREDNRYNSIFILPIAYIINSICFPRVYSGIRKSPLTILVVCGYFFRLVICPLLFCMGGYESGLTSNSASASNVTRAVLLFSLESFVVFFVASSKYKYRIGENEPENINFSEYNVTLANTSIVLLTIFLIFAYYSVPALKTIYIFLPNANLQDLVTLRWDNETIVARGSSSRVLYSLFIFLWQLLRMPIMAYFMSIIYKRRRDTRFGVWLSMLCLLIPSIFLSGDNITPILGALLGILVISRLYVNTGKGPIRAIGIVFIIAFLAVFISKVSLFTYYGGTSTLSTVSQTLNAYIPGFDNAAAGFAKVTSTNKFEVLFNDFMYAIPFNQTLFGVTGDRFTRLFGMSINSTGSIPPFGYQLAFYFGIPISAIITGLIVNWAYNSEIKSFRTSDFWTYFLNMFFSIYTGISISCYSFSTFISSSIGMFLPLWLIVFFGRKRKNSNVRR